MTRVRIIIETRDGCEIEVCEVDTFDHLAADPTGKADRMLDRAVVRAKAALADPAPVGESA